MNHLSLWASFCLIGLILACQISPSSAERTNETFSPTLSQNPPRKLKIRSQISNAKGSSLLSTRSMLSKKITWETVNATISNEIDIAYDNSVHHRAVLRAPDIEMNTENSSSLLVRVDEYIASHHKNQKTFDQMPGMFHDMIMSINGSNFNESQALTRIGVWLSKVVDSETASGDIDPDIKSYLGLIQLDQSKGKKAQKSTDDPQENAQEGVSNEATVDDYIIDDLNARFGVIPNFTTIQEIVQSRVRKSFTPEYCQDDYCRHLHSYLKNLTRHMFLNYTQDQTSNVDLQDLIKDHANTYADKANEALLKYLAKHSPSSNDTSTSSTTSDNSTDTSTNSTTSSEQSLLQSTTKNPDDSADWDTDDVINQVKNRTDELLAEHFEGGVCLSEVMGMTHKLFQVGMLTEFAHVIGKLVSATAARMAIHHVGKAHNLNTTIDTTTVKTTNQTTTDSTNTGTTVVTSNSTSADNVDNSTTTVVTSNSTSADTVDNSTTTGDTSNSKN